VVAPKGSNMNIIKNLQSIADTIKSLQIDLEKKELQKISETESKKFLSHITGMAIPHPIKGNIPFDPYFSQTEIIDFLFSKKNLKMINNARQMGTSLIITEYLHYKAQQGKK
jgi:hypothetical protein